MKMLNNEILKNIILKYSKLNNLFKSFFVVIIFLIIIYGINLLVLLSNKPKSAYSYLTKDKQIKLQDTRLHNWSEIKESDKQ